MSSRRSARTLGSLPAALPPSRTVPVRAPDGTRLHTEVFGPENGYPIVLSHGITCAIRVWAYQIADLATDYRVIAFDHRGHGRSGIPRRGGYSLAHLASDVDAVLEATLAPGQRAVIAGHSMGGMALAAWSDRYRHKVEARADAVALINTTTGVLLREVRLLPVPAPFAAVRVLGGRALVNIFGSFTVPPAVRRASREMISMLAVGRDADPAVGALIYELFNT
ncbi:MAG: alpha/beta fold hydrolase, partial [Mycobacterium sp.]